jgi:hypothetical protein
VVQNQESVNTMMSIIANTQQEYWRREFKGEVYEKDKNYQDLLQDLISRDVCPVFQIDNDEIELNFLETLKPNSVIVWCHSDESYDIDFNRRISGISAVRLILRPYKLPSIRISSILYSIWQTLINLRYSPNSVFALKILMWQFRGLSMVLRQYQIKRIYSKKKKFFKNFPIGYTNIFAYSMLESIREKRYSEGTSLFKVSEESFFGLGSKALTFSGQIGQVVRETAIKAASNFPDAHLICRSSYGASNVLDEEVKRNGLEYFELLKDSRSVLCPPGNISGESFRVFETVLMRRIPLVKSFVTSDPCYEAPIELPVDWQRGPSWGSLINGALKSDLNSLELISNKNFLQFQDDISTMKRFLEGVTGSA